MQRQVFNVKTADFVELPLDGNGNLSNMVEESQLLGGVLQTVMVEQAAKAFILFYTNP
jgi:hypothetical protein